MLEELIKSTSYIGICKQYNVSEKTLRDVLRKYGIHEPRINKDYNMRQIALDILDGMTRKEIMQKHNVSEWTIQRTLQEYQIPSFIYTNEKPVACKLIPNGAYIQIFESLTAAMQFIYGDEGTKTSRNSMRWKIGDAAKRGTRVKGYYWEFIDKQKLINSLKSSIIDTL